MSRIGIIATVDYRFCHLSRTAFVSLDELDGAFRIVSVALSRPATLRSMRPVALSLNLTSTVLGTGIKKLARAIVSALIAALALPLLDSLAVKSSEP
jgi:hypothetical protein